MLVVVCPKLIPSTDAKKLIVKTTLAKKLSFKNIKVYTLKRAAPAGASDYNTMKTDNGLELLKKCFHKDKYNECVAKAEL
jgi:hypothetical protein